MTLERSRSGHRATSREGNPPLLRLIMPCTRCSAECDTADKGWCPDCERAFDTWVRRHASDILWPVLAGMFIITATGMGLPMLGLGWVVATTGVFAGFGTLLGLQRLSQRRRRRQFLQAPLPRAYLPGKT